MKGKNKVILGVIIIFVGIAQIVAVGLLTSNRPELRILSPISSGILGGCLAAGIQLIQRGRNPKADKQKRIEQHDERNLLIQGKAAYIAFCAADILILFFGAYVFHILENETAGLICYGIAAAAWIIYGIAYKLISRTV